MDELRILSPIGLLGYGIFEHSLAAGMAREPHCIAVDAGSSDPGPYYLGTGRPLVGRLTFKRDLAMLLRAARLANIPLMIGTAGGSGGEPHLGWALDVLYEIASEEQLSFKLAVIHAEQDREMLKGELASGRITPLEPLPPLQADDLDRAVRVVGQMGVDPFIAALEAGADVVLAGRSCDVSMFAALPIQKGYPVGLTYHMAKILECGAFCAVPIGGNDAMLARLYDDHFVLEPLNPIRRTTELSVAAHSLYEQPHPYRLYEPAGMLDLVDASYRQVDERRVAVSGSKFVPAEQYTIKLEGVCHEGYRSLTVAGVRDPAMIENFDEVLQAVRTKVEDTLPRRAGQDYQLMIHAYGRDGVMGAAEPRRNGPAGHELGVVIEVIAERQDLADSVCSLAQATMCHYQYEGCKSTAANLAFLTSPTEFPGPEVFRFNVYHLWAVDDPCAPFPMELVQV
jgi:hypothetical protein